MQKKGYNSLIWTHSCKNFILNVESHVKCGISANFFLRTWTFHFYRFGTLSVITHSKSLYFGALTPRWILLPFTHTYPTTHTHSEKPEKKEKNRKEILICSGLMAGVSFEVKFGKYWFKVRALQIFQFFFYQRVQKSIFCLSPHILN